MQTDKNSLPKGISCAASCASLKRSGTSKDLLDAVKQEDIALLDVVKNRAARFREYLSLLLELPSVTMQRKIGLSSPKRFQGHLCYSSSLLILSSCLAHPSAENVVTKGDTHSTACSKINSE